MEVFGIAVRLFDRIAQAWDLLDFLTSPLRHWERWRTTVNPVQFFFACFMGLAVILVIGFRLAGLFGPT